MKWADPLSPSSDWIPVGSIKLKVSTVYSGLSHLGIKDAVHFAACPYSGPVAVCSGHGNSWRVSIFSASGVVFQNELEMSDVYCMMWTRAHRLMVLDGRGGVQLISPRGGSVSSFRLAEDMYVRDACLFGGNRDSGLAIIDDQKRIFITNQLSDHVTWSLHLPCDLPTAWLAVQPHQQLTSVLVVSGVLFYRAIQGERFSQLDTPWAASDGEYTRASADWANRSIALLHSHNVIHITPMDVSVLLWSIPIRDRLSVRRMGWISNTVVFLQSASNLHFYSIGDPDGDSYIHRTGLAHVGTELDGLYVYSEDTLSFISIVSVEEEAVFGVASSAYGALLFEAQRLLDSELTERAAYEYAVNVRDMGEAIGQCLGAAARAEDPHTQKTLLKAARLGMLFSNSFDVDERFVHLLRKLRVLNECRLARNGIPITHAQLRELSESVLVGRLVDVHSYGLAIRVCRCLGFTEDEDSVLLSWVKTMILGASRSADPILLDQKIAAKLASYPHVAYADVSEKALQAGAPELARLLIARETDHVKQVKVLLKFRDSAEALAKAVHSQQPQLLHIVIKELMRTENKQELELKIRKIPQALCVYQDYMKDDKNNNQMLALLIQGSDFERKTLFHLDQAVSQETTGENRVKALTDAKESAALLKEHTLVDLLGDAIASTSSDSPSIREQFLAAASDPIVTQKYKQQFKLTDRQVWTWTIEGLARMERWQQLIEFSKKKSPVGYLPFVRVFANCGNTEEALKLLPKLSHSEQIEAHLALRNFVTAAKLAADKKDLQMLTTVYMKSTVDKEAYNAIGQLLKQFT